MESPTHGTAGHPKCMRNGRKLANRCRRGANVRLLITSPRLNVYKMRTSIDKCTAVNKGVS
jgi:hypothetical protein